MVTGVATVVAEEALRARHRLGLPQARVAELLGTKQSNLSAYECGRQEPGSVVEARLAAFVALNDDTAFAHGWPGTLAMYARRMREAHDDEETLRIVIQASDDFTRLGNDVDRSFFLAEPSPTGDPGLDALLAGLAVTLSRRAHMSEMPVWTRDPGRFLDAIWWFGAAHELPSLRARTLLETPSALRARGVMFSGRNLESV